MVELERQGRLDTLVTQNIDGLHQAAGNDPGLVVEIHGTMREVVCLRCGARNQADEALGRVRAGEADPPPSTGAPRLVVAGHPQVGHHQLRAEPGGR